MYFPKFWAKGSATGPSGTNQDGAVLNFEAWGWSDLSEEDAAQRGSARAQRALSRAPARITGIDRNAYYEDLPFREPLLENVSREAVPAVITRNAFGCEVLNTDGVAFADLDYIPARVSFWQRLTDFNAQKKAVARESAWLEESLASLRAGQASNPTLSFRTYRTAGGLGLLVTSRLLHAGSEEASRWLNAVGSDP